jgi:hypothetical protein
MLEGRDGVVWKDHVCKYAPCHLPNVDYHNPSFGLVTKAKRLQGCGPKEGSQGAKAKRPQGCGPKGSPKVTSCTPGNVRKCEGV